MPMTMKAKAAREEPMVRRGEAEAPSRRG